MSTLAMQAADPLLRYCFDITIGCTFTDRTLSFDSNQESQNGLLVVAGVDYTVNNFGTTSFKLYGVAVLSSGIQTAALIGMPPVA